MWCILNAQLYVKRPTRWSTIFVSLLERIGYSHLKEEALDRTMWRARFVRGFGPVVRQTTKWMNVLMYPTSSSGHLVLLMKMDTILCEVGTAVLGTRKMEINFCLQTLKINNSHIFLVDKLFLFTRHWSFHTLIFPGFIFSQIYETVNWKDQIKWFSTVL